MRMRIIPLLAVGGLMLMSCGEDDGSSAGEVPAPLESIESAVTQPENTEPVTTETTVVTAPGTTQPDRTTPAVAAGWMGVSTGEICSEGPAVATPDGTLWVGSLGLYRWDGESWSWITHEQGLPASPGFDPDAQSLSGSSCGGDNESPSVLDLAASPDGMLWLVVADGAVDTGLVSYDGDVFAVYARPPEAKPTRDVHGGGLYADTTGAVWLYLTDYQNPGSPADPDDPEIFTGAARLDSNGEWTVFELDEPLPVMSHRFVVGRDGTAWFTGADGVWRLEDGIWVPVETGPIDEAGYIPATPAGPDGDLWVLVAGDDGAGLATLGHWVDGTWEVTDTTDELAELSVWDAAVAPDGALWIAATPSAALQDVGPDFGDPEQFLVLVSFDGKEFAIHRPDAVAEDVGLDVPFFITTDGTSIWVGPAQGGDLVRYTPGEG
jgi:hypothetical protein